MSNNIILNQVQYYSQQYIVYIYSVETFHIVYDFVDVVSVVWSETRLLVCFVSNGK